MTFEETYITRAPRDKEHPYLMISKAIARDTEITVECKGFLFSILCNVDHWQISTRQLMKNLNLGRDAVRKLFNESIKAGYIQRDSYIDKGLKRIRYYVSESAEFKKCLPRPDFQGPGRQAPETQAPLKNTTLKEEHLKRATTSPLPSSPPDPKKVKPDKAPVAASKKLTVEEELMKVQSFQNEIDAVIAYYRQNKAEIDSKDNPIGWTIRMVELGKHKNAPEKNEVIEKRKAWAQSHEFNTAGGYMVAKQEGIIIGSISGEHLIKYNADHQYWNERGMPLKRD